jgi:hypothetical protein
MHTISAEPDDDKGEANAVGDRESHLRRNLVKATQTLNGLDNELVEWDSRLVGSSKEIAQELRQAIPTLGRRLIALVQTLNKEGLKPNNLRFFGDLASVGHDSKSERAEANSGMNLDTKDSEKKLSLAST